MASWGFSSLWGGQAAKKKDSTKNAILGLRSTLEMLSKREKHLENQMAEQDAIARKNVNANKGRKLQFKLVLKNLESRHQSAGEYNRNG